MDVEGKHQLLLPLASGSATGSKGDKKVTSLILPLFRPTLPHSLVQTQMTS